MKLALASIITVSLPLVGCGYTLQGYVSSGGTPSVMWMEGAPKAPDGPPVAGASIALVRDPTGMHPETVATAISGPDGSFKMNVTAFGAGWMQEQWLIRSARGKVGKAEWIGSLPGGGQWVIIVLGAGDGPVEQMWKGNVGTRDSAESIIDEANKYR
ncbi:MAG: hypothetical protein U0572_04485 [Phycisphaerales bacterium]